MRVSCLQDVRAPPPSYAPRIYKTAELRRSPDDVVETNGVQH